VIAAYWPGGGAFAIACFVCSVNALTTFCCASVSFELLESFSNSTKASGNLS